MCDEEPQRAHVAIFLASLDGGGAERSILTIANGLARRGVPVSMILAHARGSYLEDIGPGINLIDLSAGSTPAALLALARTLRKLKPTVVLSAMSHANVVASLAHRLAGSRARLVLSERVNPSSLFSEYRDLRTRIVRAGVQLTYPWANAIITVSQGVAADLLRCVPLLPERVVTVYNPVVDERLRRLAHDPPAHPWLRERTIPVVLAAGRLVGQKDFGTLIDAFAELRRKRPLRLVILGEGELRQELMLRAMRAGVASDVSLPGFDSNPFASMRAASVFVLSSRFEGLPGVLIQAMACGTPVVSTDCPSGPSEILEGGRWGELVPIGDPVALASAIAASMDAPDPPDVRARASDFGADAAVERYAEVLGITLSTRDG